jgi:hypothetical protein
MLGKIFGLGLSPVVLDTENGSANHHELSGPNNVNNSGDSIWRKETWHWLICDIAGHRRQSCGCNDQVEVPMVGVEVILEM